MIGVFYLAVAVGFWTLWAVLSARMGDRFSPLNCLLWTGIISAIMTGGGVVVHCRQLRLPSGGDWWLLTIFCAANIIASFGYYAALRHLPGMLVLPLSHLYLVFAPLLLALLERRPVSLQQMVALCVIVVGIALFLTGTPATEKPISKPLPLTSEEVYAAANLQPAGAGLKLARAGLGQALQVSRERAGLLQTSIAAGNSLAGFEPISVVSHKTGSVQPVWP